MTMTTLPLTVCLLDPDPVALANLAAAFAPVAGEILTAVTPAGESVPATWRHAGIGSAVSTAAGLNELTAQATQPWVLIVPPGMRPAPATLPWLQQHLPTLAPGQYIGLPPVPGQVDTMHPWLFAGQQQWWDGPPLRLGGERGEDLPVSLLPGLVFQAPAPLPDWFEVDEADLCRHMAGLQGVLARFPQSVRAHFELAQCLRLADRHLEAYALLREAWKDTVVREAWVPGELPGLLALVASDLGESDAATAYARYAIDQEPNNLGAWEILTRMRFAKEGAAAALVEADGWWAACMRCSPVASRTIVEQPGVIAEAIRHLVWSLTANGRLDAARDFSTLGEAPPDLPVHIALESNLLDAAVDLLVSHHRDPQSTRRMWDRMIQPLKGVPDYVRGLVWSSLGGNYYRQLALQSFNRVVEAYPDVMDVYWRRAIVLAMRPGDLSAARNDLYKALRLEPRAASLWRRLAEVCRLLGDEPGAQTAFREAHRLGAMILDR